MLAIKKYLAVIVLIMIIFSLTSCQNQQEELFEETFIAPEQTSYNTVSPFIGDFELEEIASGSVAYDYKRYFCFEESGYFNEYLIEKGDSVKKGDKIASYTTGVSLVDLEETKLELERLEQSYNRTVENYKVEKQNNNKILSSLEKGSYEYNLQLLKIEQTNLEEKSYISTAKKSLENKSQELANIKNGNEQKYLLAPYDGVITNLKELKNGESVTSLMSIAEVTTNESYLIRVKDVNVLDIGDTVTVDVTRQREKTTLIGEVVSTPSILPSDIRSQYSYIKINLVASGKSDINFSGADIKVKFTSQYMPDVLLVDFKAVKKDGTALEPEYYVNILQDSVVKKRYITVKYTNTDYYWVQDGITVSDQLVVE